jgi:hypothetical protein
MKLSKLAFTSILSLFLLSEIALAQNTNPPAQPGDAVPPKFKILEQPDAPLRIVSAETRWALPRNVTFFEIFIVVENVSQLSVRAYTTCRDGGEPGKPLCFPMSLMPGQLMLPGKRDGRSSWQNLPDSEKPPTIWIDFVEMSDGSQWGADSTQSAEQLDGERAGARAQREQLLNVLRNEGPEAVIKVIQDHFEQEANQSRSREKHDAPKMLVTIPPGHSGQWEESFRQGARTILVRVIRAHSEFGPSAIEAVMRNPYDASERK